MGLTNRAKWGIATVAIPVLAAALLYVYAILPEKEDIPPATGEVRTIHPSWIDRAFSFYYEKKTDEPIIAIIRQEYPAQTGAISPDGKYIATGGTIIRDVAISSIAEKRIAMKLAIDSGSVRALAISPDGRYLASGHGLMASLKHNDSVDIWDMQSGRLARKIPGPVAAGKYENEVTALAFSPDSRHIAVSFTEQQIEGSIHLYDVVSGERLQVMHSSSAVSGSLFFFGDGKYLGSQEYGGNFNVYETGTGKRVQQFSQHGAYAVSPDGRYLAAGLNSEERLKLFDLRTGHVVKVLGASRKAYRIVTFSPDGRYLAVSGDDGLAIWDISAGKVLRDLKGQPDIMGKWMGFDAGGKYFAAVCNRYVVVWDFNKLISTGR